MSVLDLVRGRMRRPTTPSAWDDGSAAELAADVATLAAALDPQPDDPRVAASRAAVLGAFAAATADVAEARVGVAGRARQTAGSASGIRRGRYPAVVLAATVALLALGIGTVAASAPGGPLYGLRVTSEEIFLPSEPDDRSWAQVERLDGRIAEASAAIARGDPAAVVASLDAYVRIAGEAAEAPPIAQASAAQLAARIRMQIAVISRIGAEDPTLRETRTRAQVAARAMLAAIGQPVEGPGAGQGPAASDGPASGGGPSHAGSPTPGGSGGSGGPERSGAPMSSASPNGPNASPSPSGQGGPRASTGPTGMPGSSPSPDPSPSGSPAPLSSGSGRASAAPGGGSGPPSPGGGASTEQPGGGSMTP